MLPNTACLDLLNVYPCAYNVCIKRKGNKQMTELEMTIATDLGIYANDSLDGEAFWAEVARLLTFGDDFEEEMYNQTY